MQPGVPTIARQFGEIGRDFYARGWVLGTSGNFSTLVSRKPLTLAITASAVPKGAHRGKRRRPHRAGTPTVIGSRGQRRKRSARTSAEALLHVTVARVRHAGAVFAYTFRSGHDLSTCMQRAGGPDNRRLRDASRASIWRHHHEHAEWLPILVTHQNMERLAPSGGRDARCDFQRRTPFSCGSTDVYAKPPGMAYARHGDVEERFG